MLEMFDTKATIWSTKERINSAGKVMGGIPVTMNVNER